jgi:hypothetical protein
VFITLENPSRDMLTKPPRLGGAQSKTRNPQSKRGTLAEYAV